jgi:hypothetical protein
VIGAPAAVLALSLAWMSPGPGIDYGHSVTTAPNGGPIKVHVLRTIAPRSGRAG